MASLQPVSDKVLVRPLEADQTTKAGIVIPDSAKEKPQKGEVLAVGPGAWDKGQRRPMSVKKGDLVVFAKYGGDEVELDGEELKVISESDILAVIKN